MTVTEKDTYVRTARTTSHSQLVSVGASSKLILSEPVQVRRNSPHDDVSLPVDPEDAKLVVESGYLSFLLGLLPFAAQCAGVPIIAIVRRCAKLCPGITAIRRYFGRPPGYCISSFVVIVGALSGSNIEDTDSGGVQGSGRGRLSSSAGAAQIG
jgi:hypothetical protein